VGWIDRIGGIAALGTHTAYEVAVFLDWYEFLRKVADGAGVDISPSVAEYDEACRQVQLRNFDAAFERAKAAVQTARSILKSPQASAKLADMAWRRREAVLSLLSQARAEGINVSGFDAPLRVLDTQMASKDYAVAFDTADSLLRDVQGFLSAVRSGRPYAPSSATYDMPPGTTDIITVNYNIFEGSGWLQEYYQENAVIQQIIRSIKENAPGVEVLGYKVVPPRIIIFVRSPLAPLVAFLIALVITTICAVVAMYFAHKFLGIGMDKEIAEKTLDLEKQREQFISKVYDDLREGRISPETAKMLIDGYNEGYEKTVEETKKAVSGMGIVEKVAIVAVVVAGAYIAAKTVPNLVKGGGRVKG